MTSDSLVVLGPDVELRHVLPAGAAGSDAHAPLGVLGSLEDALLHEALLPERLKATWSGILNYTCEPRVGLQSCLVAEVLPLVLSLLALLLEVLEALQLLLLPPLRVLALAFLLLLARRARLCATAKHE